VRGDGAEKWAVGRPPGVHLIAIRMDDKKLLFLDDPEVIL
jgi:hypothetical protein